MMKKRILAAVLASILIFTAILSAAAIVLEATHDCSGDDCDICELLTIILDISRAMSLSAILFLIWTVAALIHGSQIYETALIRYSTPVSQKVRLLN